MAKRAAVRKKLDGGFDAFFEGGFAKGWVFRVPAAFADQLDISRTTKGATMGACFSFDTGDVFYDDESAYALDWESALLKTGRAVCIEDATPSSIINVDGDAEGGAKKAKYVLDGSVKFSLYRRRNESGLDMSSPETFETGQWDFAEFLRTGILPGEA